MPLLPSLHWRTSYRHEDGDLVRQFFVPALSCAVQYDRMTGYFSAEALALAARGLHELIRNGGRMRLVVGCSLDADEVEAMEAGYAYREDPAGFFQGAVGRRLAKIKLEPPSENARESLGALAWLIANRLLDVKVAVPVDPTTGRPARAPGLYHEKVGIVTDREGNRIAFSGSINETEAGWLNNRESFHVHCSWESGRDGLHVADEVEAFARLWEGRARSVRVVDFPEAEQQRLLEFLPTDDRFLAPPAAPETKQPALDEQPTVEPEAEAAPRFTPAEVRAMVWTFLRHAARLPNGIRVGEVTSAVVPWPHQLRAFKRMWDAWPVRMLEASEVGLGKTTIAGLVLRQALLAGRAKRVLIMVPAGVIPQWRAELYEKFGLHVPVYDGQRLAWAAVPGYAGPLEKSVGRQEWFGEPVVLTSSHLMRRRDRAADLLSAEDWDLVILDEAHHARRRGAGTAQESGPNALLRLMQGVAPKTKSLLLLTATPMQVHPVEVFDLLKLLGLPDEWDAGSFSRYFELAAKPSPSNEELAWLAGMFRTVESAFGATPDGEIAAAFPKEGKLARQKVMKALREAGSTIPLRQLDAASRELALAVLRRFSPVRARMSRYTRALLRRYHAEGLIKATVARRQVSDRMVEMSSAERELYRAVEDYISTTYNAASKEEKNAVGFILTVYRRRLASSVYALKKTLLRRLDGLAPDTAEEDLPLDQKAGDALSPEEAADLASEGLMRVEAGDIRSLLKQAERVGTESKAKRFLDDLAGLFAKGHDSAVVFTQYADTMEWLADLVAEALPDLPIGTFSGGGGRLRDRGGAWSACSKEQVKLALKHRRIRLLIATDAAGEGLNLQFCGALVNFDLPWNPMKVEQRIGRIDRIGQAHSEIAIVNLAYKDTVEADVYMALGTRINLFEGVVGKLQPILSRLPRQIEEAALARPEVREAVRARFLSDLESEVKDAEGAAFDIDEVSVEDLKLPDFPPPSITPADIEVLLRNPRTLPPGWTSRPLDVGSFGLSLPGQSEVRVTSRPDLFDDHPESMGFFTLGSPLVESGLAGSEDGGLQVSESESGDVEIRTPAGEPVRDMASLMEWLAIE